MAIRKVDEKISKRPIELLRKDFDKFEKSDYTVCELIEYDEFNKQSVRTAAIKVMHEHENKIKFFTRNNKFYLSKD